MDKVSYRGEDELLPRINEQLIEITTNLLEYFDAYLLRVATSCERLCRTITMLFQPYEEMEFDQWINETKTYNTCCSVLINLHKIMLDSLDEITLQFCNFLTDLDNRENKNTKLNKEVERKAKRNHKIATASSFVPIFGVVPALAMNSSAKASTKNAQAIKEVLPLIQVIRSVINDRLVPVRDQLDYHLRETMLFFEDIKDLLISLHDFSLQGKETKTELDKTKYIVIAKGRSVELLFLCDSLPNSLSKMSNATPTLSNQEEEKVLNMLDVMIAKSSEGTGSENAKEVTRHLFAM